MKISFNRSKKQNPGSEKDAPRPDIKSAAIAAAGKCRKAALDIRSIAAELYKSAGDVKYDIEQIRDRDPAATSAAEVILFYSGFHALSAYRLAHAFNDRGYVLTARAISQGARLLTGIEIHPGAQIGRGLFVDHGSGVVIGETAVIGDNCTIYQGATLGGTGKDCGKRHPTLGNNVMVGAGAKVLGPINIGNNTKIAAGAVVLKDVPEGCTAVGIPARNIHKKSRSRVQDLDQIHIPDPVAREFTKLKKDIAQLKETVENIKKQEE